MTQSPWVSFYSVETRGSPVSFVYSSFETISAIISLLIPCVETRDATVETRGAFISVLETRWDVI